MVRKDFPSAKRTTGTSKPSSTATATPMWTCSLKRILSPSQLLFTFGCCFRETATALITMSLKEILSGVMLVC
jgi:hypothetical protein